MTRTVGIVLRRRIGRLPWIAASIAACGLVGCVPKARPLPGTPTPRPLPNATLPPSPQRVVFRWSYAEEGGPSARGEGVARVAPPDSGRLDFYLDGGIGGGYAVLVGDRVRAPGGDLITRLLPPAPLLWAALGRLAISPAADTVARVSGDTLRADVGRDPLWRVTFVGPRLTRLERLDGGRVVEWVTRDSNAVRYRHEAGRRGLALDITRTDTVDAFPPSLWQR